MSQFAQTSGTGARGVGMMQDVVGVYDGYEQVFRDARPMTASVREGAKLMEHPLESGATVTDHMVIQPVEIELLMTLLPAAYRDTYQEIKALFLEGRILTVQTRADSYRNMIIAELPHDEDPEVFDTITLTLKLKEVKLVKAQYEAAYHPRRAEQAKTTDRGEVRPEESQSGSWLSGVLFK